MDKKKLFALVVPALVILATSFVVTVAFGFAVTPATATTSPMGNITIMINDFVPTFFQLMIVIVFVMLLLVLVAGISRKV
jgi:hypothetical protein